MDHSSDPLATGRDPARGAGDTLRPADLGAVVTTADGSLTLAHREHGETYHSTEGARGEAETLYGTRSGIRERFAVPELATEVLDVGLGLGYNALGTIRAWRAASRPGALRLVSLEVDRRLVDALASGSGAWQANWDMEALAFGRGLAATDCGGFQAQVPHPSGTSACTWEVLIGDAAALPLRGPAAFHFVWQDPFSPAKNPELWSVEWFAHVRAHAAPGCVLHTYSVAGAVRRALAASGWRVERVPTGTARKRHWLRATAI